MTKRATGITALLLLALWGVRPAHAACDVTVPRGGDIAAAIAALPDDGHARTVCLGAGDYLLRRFVPILRDGVHLRGSGAATVLRMQDGVAQPLIVIGDWRDEAPAQPVRDVSIEHLKLVGARADHEFMPEHPYLSNSAIVVRRGENIALQDLELDACRSACILTERDTRGVRIERNRILGAVWDGVSFNRSAQVTVRDNEIRGNSAAGITAEHLEDSEIRGNTIAGNGSHGLYLSDSLRNRVVANRIENNRHAAVFLTCAVRFRDPQPVLCWDNSMSQGNVFEDNRLARNEHGYDIGADRAANCKLPQWQPNVWRDNRSDAPNRDPRPEQFGLCTRAG
ncbi:right-handed parallel beta-helix repeat-containing protein [Solimonas soli]|uniref:right-handed parallel beta-helix repeat-containing protein n=1 Tax=Solimonas soli TaxID=413479 RepID=UPI0006853708|nr:right-handed parallel beta-helix repeat-containing protein [Solimonas soli]